MVRVQYGADLAAVLERWRWLGKDLHAKVHVASPSGPGNALDSWRMRLPLHARLAAWDAC